MVHFFNVPLDLILLFVCDCEVVFVRDKLEGVLPKRENKRAASIFLYLWGGWPAKGPLGIKTVQPGGIIVR